MLSRIDRIRRTVAAKPASRTEADSQDAEPQFVAGLPVPVGEVYAPRPPRRDLRQGDCELVAQLIGQRSERRGLRAGPAFIDQASSAYNRAQWSGSYDRRARQGRRTRTDI
jgi:hypothetical protein